MSLYCFPLKNSENFIVKATNNKSKHSSAKIHSSQNELSNPIVCRICQTNSSSEILLSPCSCKGTLAYVHLSCLERWLNQSSRNYCELCKFHYNSTETLRYTLLESLRVWIRHHRDQTHIRSDLLIGILLTLVTAGLIAVCLCGLDYFVLEGGKIGLTKNCIQLCITLFLLVVLAGYLATVVLILRDHMLPWYHWWRRTVNIRLQMPEGSRV